MKTIYPHIWCLLLIVIFSCERKNPNKQTEDVINTQRVVTEASKESAGGVSRTVYVPIYSDIYVRNKNTKVLLTATLSIRNTSETDTLFMKRVDYFDTHGKLVRKYLEQSIYLYPLETIDYVIEQEDKLGGSGANFLIDWYANQPIKPIFQAVMVGGDGNEAFSFTTDGINVD